MIQTFVKGVGYLTPDFFTNFSSSTPSQAGIKGALAGTIWLMISIIPISIVLGVDAAIYLEEYAKDNFFTSFVKISISNLGWCTFYRIRFTWINIIRSWWWYSSISIRK